MRQLILTTKEPQMGLNLNVPLPGPFSYSHRIGGRRASQGPGAIWWLLIGLWWVPTKYTVLAVVWLLIITCRLCALAYTSVRAGVRGT